MAGRIPDQFIDDLIARVDIVDLIEGYLPLRKAGREFHALCPFHGEKTPSFTVSREKQFYHCFGCGAHGTAIGFLMNYRNLDFREAVEELAQSAGMEVPREARREGVRNTRGLFELLERARAFYETQLRQAADRQRAVDYFKRRGISGEIAKRFRLGYAPEGWRNLFDHLTGAGVAEEEIERAGLAIRREHGGYYDRFRDRVMFPIHDRRGRVLGFGGRILDQGEPKYLNSPETEVFHKGRELYGLAEVLAAGTPARLVVVEGYMDVIALHQFGLTDAVATLGTAVTADHVATLFRHAPAVVFCFDGDAAGRRAAWKALEVTLPVMEGNREVRFCFLPEGHDPDTAVREFGPEGLFTASRTFGLSDYLVDGLKADIDTATSDGRTRLLARAAPYFKRIPDLAHRAAGAQRLAAETGFDEEIVRHELGFAARRAQRRGGGIALDRFSRRSLEEHTLALLLQRPGLHAALDEASAAFLREELDGCETLLEVWAAARAGAGSTATLLERFRGSAAEPALAALAAVEFDIPDEALEQEMRDAVARLHTRAEDRRFGRLKAIPFAELTAAQKDIMRNYRRGR